MRYVTIPPSVQLEDGDKSIDFTFSRFLRELIWREARWGVDSAWEEAAEAMGPALDKAKPGAVVELLDEHWEKLAQVARTKYGEFNPAFVLELQQLARAITRAPAQKPAA